MMNGFDSHFSPIKNQAWNHKSIYVIGTCKLVLSSFQDNFLLTELLPVTLMDWNKILQIFIVNFSYPGNKILSHNKYIKIKISKWIKSKIAFNGEN